MRVCMRARGPACAYIHTKARVRTTEPNTSTHASLHSHTHLYILTRINSFSHVPIHKEVDLQALSPKVFRTSRHRMARLRQLLLGVVIFKPHNSALPLQLIHRVARRRGVTLEFPFEGKEELRALPSLLLQFIQMPHFGCFELLCMLPKCCLELLTLPKCCLELLFMLPPEVFKFGHQLLFLGRQHAAQRAPHSSDVGRSRNGRA